MLARLPLEQARLVRLRAVPALTTWETTRNTLETRISDCEARRQEHADTPSREAAFRQEILAAEAQLRSLDAQETDVRARASVESTRPPGCTCLGTGGLGMLTAVLSSGLTIFERYCECTEGRRLEDAALWAESGADQEDTEERARLDADRRKAAIREIMGRAGIDHRYAGCTFQGLHALLKSRGLLSPDVARALAVMARSYGSGQPSRGDYIYGEPGNGKTSLLASMARALLDAQRSVMFVHYGEINERVKASYGRRDGVGDDLFERMKKAPVLLVDDFVMTPPSPSERSRWTTLIVSRHNAGSRLLTGFSANYRVSDAALRLTGDDGAYDAQRIQGRFREMCDEMELRTGDLRTGAREDIPS